MHLYNYSYSYIYLYIDHYGMGNIAIATAGDKIMIFRHLASHAYKLIKPQAIDQFISSC